MMSHRSSSAVIALLTIIFIVPASAEWLEFGAGCPDNSDPLTFHNITLDDLISFEVELQGLLADSVEHEGISYLRFDSSPGTVPMDETGFPEVPVVTCFVAVPDDSDLDLMFSAGCMSSIECLPVYPAPLDSLVEDSTSTPYIEEFFRKDSAAYVSDEWYPSEIAGITGEFMLRDQRVAIVNVHPVQYLASEDSLRVWSDIELSVNFTGLDPVWNEDGLGYYDRLVGDRLLGYRPDYEPIDSHNAVVFRHTNLTLEPPIDPDYVIIVADGLDDVTPGTGPLQTFAEYRKNLNGFDVLIVNLNDIYDEYSTWEPWPTPDMIRDYMEDLWEWTIPGTRPTYLLLIGDHEDPSCTSWDSWLLPAYQFEYYSDVVLTANDSWYVYFDESPEVSVSVPDMIVGRLSARDRSEIEDMLDLVQTYEEAEERPYPGYLQYRRYLTRLSGYNGYSYDDLLPSAAWTTGLTDWMGYTFTNYYCGDGDPYTSDDGSTMSSGQWVDACTDEFERGAHVLFYTDHGSVHYFECTLDPALGSYAGRPDSTFDDLDVRDLTPVGNQGHVNPFVLLNSCAQNTFNWTSSQQYLPDPPWTHWICYNDDPAYPLYDFGVDCFAEELMKNTDGGAIGVFGASWITALGVAEQKANMLLALFSLGHTRIGDAMQASRLSTLDQYASPGGTWHSDFGAYNLLGDPAVDIGDRMRFRDCCDLIISPEDLEVNQYPTMSVDSEGEIVFSVAVRNAGWLDAGSFDVRLVIEDDSHNQVTLTKRCDGLDADEETTLKFVWDSHIWFDPPGTLFLTASAADPGDPSPDSWMPNNSTTAQVDILDFYPNEDGWPNRTVWSSMVPPVLCDFDGLPGHDLEIIVTNSRTIQAFRHDTSGEPIWESNLYPIYITPTPGTAWPSVPVAGNVIGDGDTELIVDGEEALMIFDLSSEEPLYSYTHTGEKAWVDVHTVALADLEPETGHEQRDEIVLLRGNDLYVFDIVDHALVAVVDGEALPYTSSVNSVSAWPMIAEVNGTGSPEIIVQASWSEFSVNATGVFVYNYDAEVFIEDQEWLHTSWRTIPAVGSLPSEGQRIAVTSGENDDGQNAPDQVFPAWLIDPGDLEDQQECETSTELSSNIFCCIMADWDPLLTGADRIIANAEDQCFAWYENGDAITGYPNLYTDDGSGRPPFPALGELEDHDIHDHADLLTTTREGVMFGFSSAGVELDNLGFPYTLPSSIQGGFVVADIDMDGKVEVVFSTMDNYLHVWELGDCAVGYAPWTQCQHDAARTGVLLE